MKWLLGLAAASVQLYRTIFGAYLIVYCISPLLKLQNAFHVEGLLLWLPGAPQQSQSLQDWNPSVFIVNIFLFLTVIILFHVTGKILKDFQADTYFSSVNAERLKLIGMLIIVLTIVQTAKSIAIMPMLQLTAWATILYYLAIMLSMLFNPLFSVGIIIMFLGEVIKKGASIQSENDLTV